MPKALARLLHVVAMVTGSLAVPACGREEPPVAALRLEIWTLIYRLMILKLILFIHNTKIGNIPQFLLPLHKLIGSM